MIEVKIGLPYTPSKMVGFEIKTGYEYVCKIGNQVFYEYSLTKEPLDTQFVEIKSQRGTVTWNINSIASVRSVQIICASIRNMGNTNMTQPTNSVWTYGYVVEDGVVIIKDDKSYTDVNSHFILAKLTDFEMTKLLK